MDHFENECVVVAGEMEDLADRLTKSLEDVRAKDAGYGVAVGLTIDRMRAIARDLTLIGSDWHGSPFGG